MKIRRLFFLGFCGVSAAVGALPSAGDTAEILRGYAAGKACVQGDKLPSEWCTAFRRLIAQESSQRAAFWLGVEFGFSFISDSAAEDAAVDELQLRRVAECATVARLRYEQAKHRLGLTDADVASLLKINAEKFRAWKARADTIDPDRSVRNTTLGRDL